MLVSFHDLAKLELNEVAEYYENESAGLGHAFITEVERCADEIVRYPGSRSRDAWLHPSPPDTPVSVRAAVSGEGNGDPDPGCHELEASPGLLGGPFLNQRPNTARVSANVMPL